MPDGTRVLYAYNQNGSLQTATNLRTAQRTIYGYSADAAHVLTAVLAPTGLPSLAIQYADGVLARTEAIRTLLGATRQFLGIASNDSLAAGQINRFAFVLTEHELKTSTTGKVTLGIEVRGRGGFNPAPSRARTTAAKAASPWRWRNVASPNSSLATRRD